MTRYLCNAVMLLGLVMGNPALGLEVGGLWLSTSRAEDSQAVWLEFGSNQRLRATLGSTIATRWSLVSRDNDRYLLELRLPYTNTRQESIELRLQSRPPQKLVVSDLATGSKLKLKFLARGRQGNEPGFLGRWVTEIDGRRLTYDFNDDGWLWIRQTQRSFSGQYQIESDDLIPIWDATGPEFDSLSLEGGMLEGAMASGAVEIFMRAKQAIKLSQIPPPASGPDVMAAANSNGDTDRSRHDLYLEVAGVGRVTQIVEGDLHPTPGLELGIAGSRGAVMIGPGRRVIAETSFEVEVGRVEFVDDGRDGVTEFLNRGGGWQTVSLLDHSGSEIWGYRHMTGTNNMAAGHLDSDGRLDFIAGFNGTDGLHRINQTGERLWKRSDQNVWHIEIVDANGDGLGEIVHTNGAGELLWRNGRGEVILRRAIEEEMTDFSLVRSKDPLKRPNLVYFSNLRSTVVLLDLDGSPQVELAAPLPSGAVVYGVWASPIRINPEGPVHTAVLLWMRPPFRPSFGGVYLYDRAGQLISRDIAQRDLFSIAAVASDGQQGDRLLVGGDGVVWEYKWDGFRLTSHSPQWDPQRHR